MKALSDKREIILVSACLVGIPSRYDGKVKTNNECLRQLRDKIWIPVCPEQLGGLPTPRSPANLKNGDGFMVLKGEHQVVCSDGTMVTENFIRGAKIVGEIARALHVEKVFLKARSPSCGVSGTMGVTAAYLSECGYELCEY